MSQLQIPKVLAEKQCQTQTIQVSIQDLACGAGLERGHSPEQRGGRGRGAGAPFITEPLSSNGWGWLPHRPRTERQEIPCEQVPGAKTGNSELMESYVKEKVKEVEALDPEM